MTWRPIAGLLAAGRPAAHPVALGGGAVLRFDGFAAAVAGVAHRLAAMPAGEAVLLAEDGALFAIGLLGALHAGRAVVLPPHPALLPAAAGGDAIVLDDTWIAATAPDDGPLPALDPGAAAVTFFTSGSSGAPKRVRRSLRGLQAEVDIFRQVWGGVAARGPVLATVSHQHLYGLTFRLLWPLAAGVPFVAAPLATWEEVLARLDADAVLITSPAHLTRMAGLSPLSPLRRPALVFSAGAPLPLAASRQAEALLGVAPTEIFGSTESGAIANRRQEQEGTPWRSLPGIAVRREPDGRLALTSPAIDGDGWHRTDDLMEPAAEGFHFRGRADRMAKIEGKRVDLAALERALEATPWTAAAAVLVLDGPPRCLGAVVVPSAAGRDRLDDMGAFRFGRLLRALLAERNEPTGLPRRWRFVADLPPAAMGKRSDATLQALFAS